MFTHLLSIKKLTLSAAGLLLVVAACSKETGTGGENSLGPALPSYIQYYIKPVELFVSIRVGNDTDTVLNAQTEYAAGKLKFFTGFTPQPKTWHAGKYYSWDDMHAYDDAHFIHLTPKSTPDVEYDIPYNPEFNRIFDSLCVAHHDTEYSKKEKRHSGFGYPTVYRGMKLDIVSDADYDPAHPAGTSLGDILHIEGNSAKEVIESGYDLDLCINPKDGSNNYQFGYPIDESLATFNRDYRKLVSGWFYIGFDKAPAATSVHRFTLTYTDEDGRTLSAVTSPVKIKAAE